MDFYVDSRRSGFDAAVSNNNFDSVDTDGAIGHEFCYPDYSFVGIDAEIAELIPAANCVDERAVITRISVVRVHLSSGNETGAKGIARLVMKQKAEGGRGMNSERI